MWKLFEIQIPVFISQFLLNTAILIHLCVACDCFCMITAELGSCYRDPVVLFRKFVKLNFTKHFDKHCFSGLILTMCNTGGADRRRLILQMMNGFAWWPALNHLTELQLSSRQYFICNAQFFSCSSLHLPKRCFCCSQNKIYRKTENITNWNVSEDFQWIKSFIAKCWLDFPLIWQWFPK